MAARRRKPEPAELRTIGLFSGKTAVEEAEDLARDEAPQARAPAGDMVEEDEKAAVRWLGLDTFHEGDDVRVAIHKGGHAVLMLVRTTKDGTVYGTSIHKLSRQQWAKLKQIAREA